MGPTFQGTVKGKAVLIESDIHHNMHQVTGATVHVYICGKKVDTFRIPGGAGIDEKIKNAGFTKAAQIIEKR